MIDSFGRIIEYLRISVTDHCNLRCAYCTPAEGTPRSSRTEILTFEEITRTVAAAARLGVRFVRLTGGEPLVRRDLPSLVDALVAIPGIEEVSLTTNGILLEKFARPLAEAGLKRVNVSLDTLQEEKYRRITRGGEIQRVLRGIAAAEAVHLHPIKINAVVIRGVNDDELLSLGNVTKVRPWHVRFIEWMPVGNAWEWGPGFPPPHERHVPAREMRGMLSPFHLQPVTDPPGRGPVKVYRIPGGLGTIGFISPLGEHFCASCNRLRLTADGQLRPCLFSNREVDLRGALERDEPLEVFLRQAVAQKPWGHGFDRSIFSSLPSLGPTTSRLMAQIGG
jgi:GTP 3',8-cyclase